MSPISAIRVWAVEIPIPGTIGGAIQVPVLPPLAAAVQVPVLHPLAVAVRPGAEEIDGHAPAGLDVDGARLFLGSRRCALDLPQAGFSLELVVGLRDAGGKQKGEKQKEHSMHYGLRGTR